MKRYKKCQNVSNLHISDCWIVELAWAVDYRGHAQLSVLFQNQLKHNIIIYNSCLRCAHAVEMLSTETTSSTKPPSSNQQRIINRGFPDPTGSQLNRQSLLWFLVCLNSGLKGHINKQIQIHFRRTWWTWTRWTWTWWKKGHLYKAQPTAGLGTRYIWYSKDIVNRSNYKK